MDHTSITIPFTGTRCEDDVRKERESDVDTEVPTKRF